LEYEQAEMQFSGWKWGWKTRTQNKQGFQQNAETPVITGGDDETRTRDLRRNRSMMISDIFFSLLKATGFIQNTNPCGE
jgi:hypothetical protein